MPLHIIRNNIVNMECDAIVNTANPYPQIGAGTDSAVYAAAGEKRLLAARQKIGEIAPGMAAVTGPVWEGGENGEEMILRSCYRTSLRIAEAKRCKSVAFPLISSGSYGYPKDAALKTAVEEIRSYLEHSNITVYLVVFGKEAYELSGKYSDAVEAFIDEHYVKAQMEKEYSGQVTTAFLRGNERRRRDNLLAAKDTERRRRGGTQPNRAADSGSKDNFQAYRTDESGHWDNLRADYTAESEFLEDQQAEMAAEIDKGSAWKPGLPYSDMSEYTEGLQSEAPGFGMPQPAMPKSAAPETATSESVQQPAMPRLDMSESVAPESSGAGFASQYVVSQVDKHEYEPSMSAAPRPAAKSSPRFFFRPAASVGKKKKKLEEAAPAGKKKKKLEDSDIVLAETFSETLLRLIDEKEMTDVEVYKRANIDRKLFSKIRSRRDYQPGKKTALALAVALRLDLDQTKDLLARAGYAISPSSKFDLIVEFFIVNEVYDIDTINIALFDHQEQTLG